MCAHARGPMILMSRPKCINIVRFASHLKMEAKITSEKFSKNQTHSKSYLSSLYIYMCVYIYIYIHIILHTDSSVGIANRYGLDCRGLNPGGGEIGPGAHPASYTMGTGPFPGGVKRPGHCVDHPPHLAPSLKSTAIYLHPFWASPRGLFPDQYHLYSSHFFTILCFLLR
jgi:hypothetical protein